jgi:hypothetical protein
MINPKPFYRNETTEFDGYTIFTDKISIIQRDTIKQKLNYKEITTWFIQNNIYQCVNKIYSITIHGTKLNPKPKSISTIPAAMLPFLIVD